MRKNEKRVKGQLLIESLVGISVVTIGLLGVVGLVSRSLSLNRVISDQFTASYLSLEGIEIARNLLDANVISVPPEPWNKGFQNDGDFSVYYDSNSLISGGNQPLYLKDGFYSSDSSGTLTSFKRTVKVTNKSSGEIQVNSVVEWTTRGGGTFKVDNEHHFYNWR